MIYDDYAANLHINFDEGVQHLDGEHSLNIFDFGRIQRQRDIGRIERQQEIGEKNYSIKSFV